MSAVEHSSSFPSVDIVRVVLCQLIKQVSKGEISQAILHSKLRRLIREELKPDGLDLVLDNSPGHQLRCLIKSLASGRTSRILEFSIGGILTADQKVND